MPEILHQEETFLVAKKPGGMPTQSGKQLQQDLYSAMRNVLAMKGEETTLYVIHRLDQPVSGLVVFARTKEAAANLSAQVAGKEATKKYLAEVWGHPPAQGSFRHWLRKAEGKNYSEAVAPGTPGAKEARLEYSTCREKEETALVEITLGTGRHHQIRVQFMTEGFPLVGDRKYGKEGEGAKTLHLHGEELSFLHPKTGKRVTFRWEPEWGKE